MDVVAERTDPASARSHMEAIVQRLITRAVGDYGMSAETAPIRAASIMSLDDQDFRFELIDRLTGGLLAQPRKLLEIGCGSAPFLYSALRRGHDAHGIDVDYERIRIAELKVDAFSLPDSFRGTARLGDATALDFPSGAFDLLTSWAVIEHIPDLEAALFESVRVLKPGGFIVYTAPDYRGGYEAHYEMPWPPMAPRSVCERWVMAMDRPPGGIGTFFPITLPRVGAVLESLGCAILAAELTLPLGHEPSQLLDVRDQAAIERTAERIKGMAAAGTLPACLRGTTVFHIAARKL